MSKRPAEAGPATDRNVCQKTTTSDADNMSDYEEGCGPPDGRGVTINGAFQIRCDKCGVLRRPTRHHPPNQFCPVGSHVQRAAYEKAMAEYDTARLAKDEAACLAARTVLLERALKQCLYCRKGVSKSNAKPTSKRGKCRAHGAKLKESKYNKCAVCGGTRAIEANHRAIFSENKKRYDACVKAEGEEIAERKYPADERKLLPLSHCHEWARPKYGGVAGMQKEDAKMGPPLCRGHHRLDPSSPSAPCNRAAPNKLKREDYPTQQQFANAVCFARTKKEKHEYVDALKRAIGKCEVPGCPCDGPGHGVCVPGVEPAFDLDHLVEPTKGRSLSEICEIEPRPPWTSRRCSLRSSIPPPASRSYRAPRPPTTAAAASTRSHQNST